MDAGNSQLAGQEPEDQVEVGPRPEAELSLRCGETLPPGRGLTWEACRNLSRFPSSTRSTSSASRSPPHSPLGLRTAPEAGSAGQRAPGAREPEGPDAELSFHPLQSRKRKIPALRPNSPKKPVFGKVP